MKKLQAFLSCTDLDDLLRARGQVRNITTRQAKHISEILAAWDPPQAVANILFYPDIIPNIERFRYLLKALHDDKQPYNKLAAVVGISILKAEVLSSDQRAEIIESLYAIMCQYSGILAERTAITLFHLISRGHILKTLALLEHSNENVRHNVLAWLIRQYADENLKNLLIEIENSSIAPKIKKACATSINDHSNKKRSGQFSNTATVLFSYVPNLLQMQS